MSMMSSLLQTTANLNGRQAALNHTQELFVKTSTCTAVGARAEPWSCLKQTT
jgi:hypothetical protein